MHSSAPYAGTGHTLTILAVGAAIILFSFVVSPPLGLTMELSVGIMLVVLSALNIFGVRRSVQESTHHHDNSIPSQLHSGSNSQTVRNDAKNYIHAHALSLAVFDRFCAKFSVYQLCRPLIVGIVHGLAGSAAVALLVLATIPKWPLGNAYSLIFGLGTIAGMMMITIALGSTICYADSRSQLFGRCISIGSG